MRGLARLTTVELKLFLRDAASGFWTVAFPILLLVIIGSVPSFRKEDPALGGERVIDLYVPILIVLAVASMALFVTPNAIAGYRQRGILRRFSTTPIGPTRILLAQLAVQLLVAAVTVTLLLIAATTVFGTAVPRQLPGFVLSFLFIAVALLAIGLLVASVVPSGPAGGGVGTALFFPLMFFAGLWVPREVMPDLLVRIGDFTPLGAAVQALTDSTDGSFPSPLALAVLAGYALLAGGLAARLFRWQ